MKDRRMMNFIHKRIREATIDLRRSCASVAETDISNEIYEDTLFDLINDADRLIVYALDLIAAKRLAYAVNAFRDLQSDEKILSEASSLAEKFMMPFADIYYYHAFNHEMELIDRIRHEVIAKNEE